MQTGIGKAIIIQQFVIYVHVDSIIFCFRSC
jgi:hypothetical protein